MLGDSRAPHLGHHRPNAFAAVFHRFGKLLGRHVGMDEVFLLVVDRVELELQLEEILHADLERRNRIPAALAGRGAHVFLRHQFVEHCVVLLELLVELGVVRFFADVDRSDQIDRQAGPSRVFRREVDDRRRQRERLAVRVADQADKARSDCGDFLVAALAVGFATGETAGLGVWREAPPRRLRSPRTIRFRSQAADKQ